MLLRNIIFAFLNKANNIMNDLIKIFLDIFLEEDEIFLCLHFLDYF
jgi:hypothetical protein